MVEITYHKEGDFLVPDLYLEKEDYEKDYIIGKYGHLRLEYLKNHKKAEYIIMFMHKTLRKHIVETDKQAKIRFEILMKQMLERNPIDKELKNTNPLEWTGLMNNYKHCVEEIVFKELIYC
ncbi:MAG TPA: TnpV protein [Clostridiales bacterium]|nr:TnpV protein [Clostridiales bacterium]